MRGWRWVEVGVELYSLWVWPRISSLTWVTLFSGGLLLLSFCVDLVDGRLHGGVLGDRRASKGSNPRVTRETAWSRIVGITYIYSQLLFCKGPTLDGGVWHHRFGDIPIFREALADTLRRLKTSIIWRWSFFGMVLTRGAFFGLKRLSSRITPFFKRSFEEVARQNLASMEKH